MEKWHNEWPTELGWYWFYGWCWSDRNHDAELHLVRVRKVSNGVMRTTNGHFLWEAEGGFGFHRIWKNLPEFVNELDVERLTEEAADD